MSTIAPYGAWKSPITAELVAANSIQFMQLALDKGIVYWAESHPSEEGRIALMQQTEDGSEKEVSATEMNVRTRVHEYGGGAFVADEGVVAYSNFSDQVLYLVTADGPKALTSPGMRYADGVVDSMRNRIICVREDHTVEGEAVNTIVAVGLDDQGPGEVLFSGHDFYTTPRLSPDGKTLSWLAYNHPEMPWTRTQLWLSAVGEDGTLSAPTCFVDGDESIFQPAWSPDGTLYFISDRDNWWNLYQLEDGEARQVVRLEAEFGRPQWIFGVPTYGFRDDLTAICSYVQDGLWNLAEVDLLSGALQILDLPYTSISDVHVDTQRVVFLGGAADIGEQIVEYLFETRQHSVLRTSSELAIDSVYLTTPEAISYPTPDDAMSHALFYPPKNEDYTAPDDERPPLIVISHGGPTSATSSKLNLSLQFWTSRGFAVLDVNYGGSTGYGREYRQRLDDRWGIVDVDDCIAGAEYLVAEGRVDGDRMVIRGGSAGGFTTLAALTFRDVFRAGASYFGVSDLGALAGETHKFESRYLDGLVGPYPERKDIYEQRSPLYHVDQLSCPIIFFQGQEDKVVLPNQAEMMVDALREKKIPVAYVPYEGEQHGFRKAKNIAHSLKAELYFYSKILDIPLEEDDEPVKIENLSDD